MTYLDAWKMTHDYEDRQRMSYILAIVIVLIIATILAIVWWAFTWVGVIVLVVGCAVASLIIGGLVLIIGSIAEFIYDKLFRW